jgi:hypothetical protein
LYGNTTVPLNLKHTKSKIMLEPTELREALREKNIILSRQTKRIDFLEEKITALRKEYFRLKYAHVILH